MQISYNLNEPPNRDGKSATFLFGGVLCTESTHLSKPRLKIYMYYKKENASFLITAL